MYNVTTLRKLMLLHFTKSLKSDNIDILLPCWMVEEHNCLVSTSLYVPKRKYRTYAPKFICNLHFIKITQWLEY